MKEQDRLDYIQDPFHCPCCGDTDVSAGDFDGVEQEVSCSKGHIWAEKLTVTDVRIISDVDNE